MSSALQDLVFKIISIYIGSIRHARNDSYIHDKTR